jgi:hypothetical protein
MNNKHLSHVNNGKTDKLTRYGWTVADKRGDLKIISKHDLLIPDEYQRDLNESKAKEYASNWSWFGCGVLVVAKRPDGLLYVVDGQHRKSAAMRRSDIEDLPCIVFETDNLKDEAKAFITTNTGRKAMSAIEKLKGLSVSGDELAAFVVNQIILHGLRITKTATKGKEIKCINACQKIASKNRQSFVESLALCAELSLQSNEPIAERVLFGIDYINLHVDGGVKENRLRNRIIAVGSTSLLEGAHKASAYFARGGEKVWAEGMLSAINKGLRTQFIFTERAAS